MANVCVFCGRSSADPKVTYTQGEKATCVARFSLAVDRRGKDSGADFPSMVAFGRTGEFVEKYVKKGTKVVVRSHYQSGSYTNRDGQKVYTTDVVVDEHEFCESKNANTSYPPSAPDGEFLNIPDDLDEELPFK